MAAPRYLNIISGVPTQVVAVETATAESIVSTLPSGLLDVSLMPTGIGPDLCTAVASAAITAGQFVQVYNNAGVLNVRPADASTTGKEANGFCLASISSSASGTVYLSGLNTATTGQTPGTKLFLSDTTPGAASATVPSAAGHQVQQIGYAITATSIQFGPHLAFTLA